MDDNSRRYQLVAPTGYRCSWALGDLRRLDANRDRRRQGSVARRVPGAGPPGTERRPASIPPPRWLWSARPTQIWRSEPGPWRCRPWAAPRPRKPLTTRRLASH